jgi:hypothetical protein
MRRLTRPLHKPGPAGAAAALTLAVVLVGGLLLLRPSLRGWQSLVAGVPSPPALYSVTPFVIAPHGKACMSSVALDAHSAFAQFTLFPVKRTKAGTAPVDLVLSAPGYRGVAKVPGGLPGGVATVRIVPPPARSLIGSACFVNLGTTSVALNGTTEARTVSRSPTILDGRAVVGDIALQFMSRPQPLLDEIDATFGHASNLTDGLVPVWLIWILALLLCAGVVLGPVAALYLAMREDEQAGALA